MQAEAPVGRKSKSPIRQGGALFMWNLFDLKGAELADAIV
jgi:hypothetical protein